jgi:hypothetical protein
MRKNFLFKRNWLIKAFLLTGLSCMSFLCYAQIDPTDSLPGDPGGLTIYTVRNMSFGAFSCGSTGGTVTISNTGIRSVTGSVIALNMGVLYFPAIFDVDAPLGSILSILNGPDATLTGSNGGTMSMHIGSSDPPSPFITTVTQPARTPVNIGATLTVGNPSANPPGIYNGTFYITFIQE